MSVCPDLLKKMIAIARPFALHANAKSTERENKTWIPIFYDITLHEMPKLAQDKPERVIWVQNGWGGGWGGGGGGLKKISVDISFGHNV